MPKSHPSFQTHLPGSCPRLEGKATLVINWLNYVMYTTMQSSQTLRSKCWVPLLEMRRQVLLPPTPVSECTWLLLPVEKLLCGELSRGSSHTPAGMEGYLETSTVFSVNIFINSFQDVWIMQSSSRQIRGPKHAKSECHLTAAWCTKWELLYMFSHSTRAPHLPQDHFQLSTVLTTDVISLSLVHRDLAAAACFVQQSSFQSHLNPLSSSQTI